MRSQETGWGDGQFNLKRDFLALSGPLYKMSKTAGIYKISVLRFGTMGGKVLMVDDLWHIDFGSILSNGWAGAGFVIYSINKGILVLSKSINFSAILALLELIFGQKA